MESPPVMKRQVPASVSAIRVLRRDVDFERVLAHLETTTLAFRCGTAAEIDLSDMPFGRLPGNHRFGVCMLQGRPG